MEQELLNRIEQLEQRLDELSRGDVSQDFINTLAEKGFINYIGPDMITYTNPSGKDFYATFVSFLGESRVVNFEQSGVFTLIESVDVAADTITTKNTSFGFSDGTSVYIASTATPPGGLNLQTNFYIVNSSGNTFQLSTSVGGTPINITSKGTGQNYINVR